MTVQLKSALSQRAKRLGPDPVALSKCRYPPRSERRVAKEDGRQAVARSTGWTNLNNNLGITQFYGVAANASTGNVIGFTTELVERGILSPEELDGLKPTWGDSETGNAAPTASSRSTRPAVYLALVTRASISRLNS